jgi:hypothetical protein
MNAKLFASAAAVLLCAQVSWAQTSSTQKPAHDDETGVADVAPVAPALVGTWKARTERLPLTGDFNEQVWGKNAVSVRDVTLSVKPTGEAVLTVSRKVLDGRGRVVPGSASVEEADITVGAAQPGLATRLDHQVKVVKAERRYPDNANDRWALDNLRVGVVSFSDGHDTIEVRFDPADGQGSFADLLTREGRAAGKTARR